MSICSDDVDIFLDSPDDISGRADLQGAGLGLPGLGALRLAKAGVEGKVDASAGAILAAHVTFDQRPRISGGADA
jgi:hypothetical protein